MQTTSIMDEKNPNKQENPGSQLARIREKKGFTKEYVAGKLHLRVRVIEHLEADEYSQLPEPVFVKGYLRAYAKLLGISPDPYLLTFNNQYVLERKPEKALWQSKRESNKGEQIVRLITGMVAVAALVAVGFWWQNNKEAQPFFSAKNKEVAATPVAKVQSSEPEAELTELSKMQSLFSTAEEPPAEKQGG